ncbi:MFS transporter [Haloferax volcanii]|uniref:MFS transporter n=2 Tax=Haloferax volcanii TaxID=2246 RepID=A0A6C0US91_HALVO|nr:MULTISPECIES: MFS transporter [Haloferax]ELZ90786.1 MFS permease [Haloferax alexandrinus JCM 10717]NLV01115.1 MFS transporter [Haloferax alexandrinus]QIB76749.1 MFS transporter [Haloferax alexandrinus]TVT94193.1 MFS transporter [Haloferax volcanii]
MTGNETRDETRDDSGGGSWRAVGSVAGWQTAASLCYYAIFAATGFVRDAFSVSESLVGLFLTAGLLGYTVFLFPSGAAVDGYGEKPVMVVGLLALSVALVGVTFAPPSYLLLLVTVALLGAAYSTAMPASNRGIVAAAPAGSKNLAMGLKQVGVTVGSGASSLVVTGVAVVAAWQVGFWAIAVFAAGYALVFATRYRGNPGTGRLERPRLAGLGGNRAYVALVAAGLFIGASIFSMLGYTVLYVQDVVGTGPALAGGVLAATQVTGSVGRIGAGSLADRLGGPRGAATVALVQLAGAVALFSLLVGTGGSFALTIAVFVALGLTIHGSTGVFYSCLSGVVDDGDIGAATAGGQTALNVGGLVAPPLFGFVVESTGYGAGWALVAGSTVLATVLLFVVRRRI